MAEEQSVQDHLRGFARSFIRREFRSRWLHILLEKPEKAAAEMRRFESHHDPARCRLVEGVEVVREEIPGLTRGLYFDGSGSPRFMSLDEGIDAATRDFGDALFSVSPGEKALFVFHEGWAWVCGESES